MFQKARNKCNTSFSWDFDWIIHFWNYFDYSRLSSKSKGQFQGQVRKNMDCPGKIIWKWVLHLFLASFPEKSYLTLWLTFDLEGGGPRVVVSTAAFHARVRGSVPGLGSLKETKNVSSPSTCESQYCGEPPWPRGSVLGLRPPRLEFQILCLEDSVISIISPSSGGSPGPV